MSFWDSVKKVGAAAAAAAGEVVDKGKQAVNELRNPPTSISCSGCQAQVPVPPEAWNWRCGDANCGKENGRAAETCAECKKAKPANIPNPKVTCAKCQAVTTVPSSGARQLLTDAKTVAVNTGSMIKKEFNNLQEKPAQFNCEHCSTLLAVPAPVPWACAACKATNQPDSAACSACGGKKPTTAAMVLCGVCQKPTAVPSSNFVVKFKAGMFDAQKAVKKLYLDISGKPYIHCPRCQTPLPVDMKKAQAGNEKQAPAKAADNKKDQKNEKQPLVEKEGQASAAPAEEPGAGVEIVCTKCAERLLVALDAAPGNAPAAPGMAAQPQAPAAAAGAPAAVAPAPAPAAAS